MKEEIEKPLSREPTNYEMLGDILLIATGYIFIFAGILMGVWSLALFTLIVFVYVLYNINREF